MAWCAPADAPSPSNAALQQAIIDGLAAGKDVQVFLDALAQQATPLARRPMPPKHTVAEDLESTLLAFRDALGRAQQQPLSEASMVDLEQAYQHVQAAHMLMMSRFESVQHELQDTAVPDSFETRRQNALSHYQITLDSLLTPLGTPLAEWRRASDRTAHLDASVFQQTMRDALSETTTLVKRYLKKPAPPILRAQALPVRPASPAPREPRIAPTIQPSYAQSTPPEPQTDDLAATPDAPLNEIILQQAQELDYDYIRIYEFVRNEMVTQDYAGAMKGAIGTLQQGSGNAVDQASLLVALLRASSLPARYVHGVIRLPIEHVMAHLGLTVDTNAAVHDRALRATLALNAAGMAYRPVIEGGRITAVDLESTWVSAYVPYTNYRGTMVDTSGPIWVPLMPAIKETTVEPSARVLQPMQTPATMLITDYLAEPQTIDLRTHIETAVTTYLQGSESDQTYIQQLGSRSIVPLALGLLPATLPAEVVAVTGEGANLEDTHRQRLRLIARAGLQEHAPIILDHTVPVAEVASQRLTLSYLPATVEDQRIANQYGGLDHVPAYLIRLRPQLKLNGRLLAVAQDAIDTGVPYRFEMHLLGPAGRERISQNLISGAYHAIGITAQEGAPAAVEPEEASDTEFLAAALLNRVAFEYSQQWTRAEDEFAGLTDVALVRPWPHVAMVNNAIHVDTIAGQPHQLHWRGVTLDAALRLSTPIARDKERVAEHDWLQLSALQGSLLEHRIFEQLFLVDSISADKGLQLARAQGVPVYHIDAQNRQTTLPNLSHPEVVLDAIDSWAGLGLMVDIPAAPLSYQDWRGSFWRVTDPDSGAAGYFITGGIAGGATSLGPTAWALSLLRDVLASPNSGEPNTDPLSAAFIHKVPITDGQVGEAGATLDKALAAYVRDRQGRPVQGAVVTFRVTDGGACLGGCVDTLDIATDARGIASVSLTLGQLTSINPFDIQLAPQDRYPTRVAVNWIEASVASITGRRLSVSSPFVALTKPKPVASLAFTSVHGNDELPAENAELIGAYRFHNDPLKAELPRVRAYQVGEYKGNFDVLAVDPYGNPVSNVELIVAASVAPLIPDPYCSHIPTHIIGENNRTACPMYPPIAYECGNRVYTGHTDLWGVMAFDILIGDGSNEDRLTVSAPDYPNVSPLTYGYPIWSCEWNSTTLLYPNLIEPTDGQGRHIHAVIAGQTSPVPIYLDVYFHKYSHISHYNTETPYVFEDDDRDRQWRRAQHPRPLWVTVEGCTDASGCASPNPMRHIGNGRYETYIKTNPTPGRNGGTIQFSYLDRSLSPVAIGGLNGNGEIDGIELIPAHLWQHRDVHFVGVTGLRLQTSIASRGAPKDQSANAIYLDADNRTRYPVDLNYTIEPSDYHALHVAVHVYKGNVLQAVFPGSELAGAGKALISRGVQFDPEANYTAQLVLNHGSKVPVYAEPIPLKIVPGKPKLMTGATQALYVSQDIDVVNQRSCLRSSPLTFTLSEEARVSLVFKDKDDQTRTHVQFDDQVFAKGEHHLPFYLPALQALAPEQNVYSLHPGEYIFALTAISTDTHNPIEDAVLGNALVEYHVNQLPVGRTLDRGGGCFQWQSHLEDHRPGHTGARCPSDVSAFLQRQ